MTHTMKLAPAPFAYMEIGQKTIELRLWDEKRRCIRAGDEIVFTCVGNPTRCLTRRVVALHRFPSFEALYRVLPLSACGYTEEEIPSAHPSDMDLYYSPEEQSRWGVVGIELTPV